MRALAFTAVLLLVLMPSASRLMAARSASAGAHAGWVELCTMTGLKLVKLAPGLPSEDGQGKGGGAPHADGDCAYCPLLNTLTALATCLVLALASLPATPAKPRGASQRRASPRAPGLGSRGPPLRA